MSKENLAFVAMREIAYRNGVISARKAKQMNAPANYVMGLNPYKGYGMQEKEWLRGLTDTFAQHVEYLAPLKCINIFDNLNNESRMTSVVSN